MRFFPKFVLSILVFGTAFAAAKQKVISTDENLERVFSQIEQIRTSVLSFNLARGLNAKPV